MAVRRTLMAGLTMAFVATVCDLAGSTQTPTTGEVKEQQQQFQAEREKLTKSGAAERFLPNLLERADSLAKRADESAKAGRLFQALEGYRQARWQLPYQGPNFPEHVAHVFGNLRLRHGNDILAIAYSPDGTMLATASSDCTVKIWDMANGHELLVYRRHQRPVSKLAFSPDGKWIASAGGDKDIRLWDPRTGKDVRTLKGTGKYTTALAISPDGKYVFAAGDELTLRIYEAATGEIKRTIAEFDKAGVPRSLAISPDGTRVAVGAENGQIRLWVYPDIVSAEDYWAQQDAAGSCNFLTFSPDSKLLVRCGPDAVKMYDVQEPGAGNSVRGPRLLWQPPADPRNKTRLHQFTCAAFAKDGKTLFIGGTDGVIRLFDGTSGNAAGTFTGHNADITSLVMNSQGTQLASASADYTVRLWNFDTLVKAQEFDGSAGPVWTADFSPDGQRFISGGADKTLRAWDIASGIVLHTFAAQKNGLTAVHYSPDGKAILSGGGDKLLRLHDADLGKVLQTLEGHTGTVTSAAFSRDGTKIVSGDIDKNVIVWSAATGRPIAKMNVGSIVMAVAFTPDGKQIAVGTVDRFVRIYNADSGKPGAKWAAHNAAVSGLSFAAKGEMLATCGFDGFVKIWRMPAPGTMIAMLAGHVGPVSAIAFRGDGNYVVSAGSDRQVRLWKNDDGNFKSAQTFRGHKDWITSVAFNDLGNLILSAGADKTIKVWEIASRELPLTAEHTGAVQCLAVSADGKWLASGGTDKTIKLWDAKTGAEIWTLKGHGQSVAAVAFSPDGKTLFSSGADRNIRRWDLANAKEMKPLAHQANLLGFINTVPQLGIRPDGQRLIAWVPFDERGTRVSLFDATTGDDKVQINDRGKHVLAVAWTRDLNRVALAAKDGNVRIYKIDQDKLNDKPADYRVFTDVEASSVAFTPDGSYLIVGGGEGQLLLLDPNTGLEHKKFAGHKKRVHAIAVSPDGKRLATAGMDDTVKLWDAESGKELRNWSMPAVSRLTFTPDGRFIITANANTTLFKLETP